MKYEENQEFINRSWVIPVLGLFALVALAVLPVSRSSPEEKVVRARSKAEVLAYQVAQLYRESLSSQANIASNSRGPASVSDKGLGTPAEGLMGQDPWGRAYNYRIGSDSEGKLHVEMRSAGPDGRIDSDSQDDIVLVLSF